jgi:RNA polymerase sigma factor (TIGR02999 family)
MVDFRVGPGYLSSPHGFLLWNRGETVGPGASNRLTQLLVDWRAGNGEALNALIPLVYDELRRLAHNHLNRERPGHTLQSTALVNEAYMRLVRQDLEINSRAHFFAVSSHLMRQILVDYARQHRAAKRGDGIDKLTLNEAAALLPGKENFDLLSLDEALSELGQMDPQQARVVELRFFGGLSIDETAEVMGISQATVKRDWATARAWLHRELSRKTG